MSKKIIIFIIAFITTGIIILGVYFWINKDKTTNLDGTTPWYQEFNPFGTGSNATNNTDNNNVGGDQNEVPDGANNQTSKFYQITDFAIAGATFLEDTRPIVVIPGQEVTQKPEPIKTIISAETKEGRKEIQIFLNETLSLKPALVVDGNFGKKVTKAIKDFQKLNNLPITGIVDAATAPFFIKTTTITDVAEKNLFETAPSVRYVERMNGHIYKMFLDTKIKEKISNSTIPSIYEALFDKTAKTVVYRYLSEDKIISSFMATLGAVKGEFLPQNISGITTSPDKTKFFYLTENSNGVTGTVGVFGGATRDNVFSSPFTEWIPQWTKNQNIYLTTKASYSVSGSVFLLNTTNKTISKIFGGELGLTTLVSPNGSNVLYSTSTETGPKLGVFNATNHSTKDLNTYGLPEKCVWSNDGISVYCAIPSVITGNQYPDIWYQGLISFDDYFVKIDTNNGEKVTMANSVNEKPLDGTYLFLDNKEDNLFFTNKKDSTFWGLDLR
ncbi:MAG: peptidoglycan-binding domain-containing protein [Candidatus Paceibacterota bacterium]